MKLNKKMKKYCAPEMKMLCISMQNIMVNTSLYDGENPVPGLDDPIVYSKDHFEDISDLFGNESFGGAEEW